MDTEQIVVRREGSIAIVTLNRPEALNAFTMEMREGIATLLEGFARDDSVRVVVITGAVTLVGTELNETFTTVSDELGGAGS